jgi:phosphatidylserine/phosphatidylglycerophosphate/cardiolipin synthase-like enzyme
VTARHIGGVRGATVATGAVFDDPTTGRRDILRHLSGLIEQTGPGALIRIAIFVVSGETGKAFARDLLAAHERGVNVQMVVDGWQADDRAVQMLIEQLGFDRSGRSWLHACTGLSPEGTTSACIGSKGMHNKFFLFSETGGARRVVVQSSANFTDLSAATHWNNALTLVGNDDLYQAYTSYFDDLSAERRNEDYYRVVQTAMAPGSVVAHFFPRAGGDSSTDTILELLAPVEGGKHTEIRVGMSEWDAYRIGIAQRLCELADSGASVRVVRGVMDDAVSGVLRSAPRVEMRALDDVRRPPGRIHSKYMLIGGKYADIADARIVITGSHNYTQTSLRRNDETLLRFDLPPIYEQYLSNFSAMWRVAQLRE